MNTTPGKPEIIIALDVPSADHVKPLLTALPEQIKWFKVGLELFTAAGPRVLEPIVKSGRKVFLDLKLHDIPNTVGRAVASACKLNVSMLTVHSSGGTEMMKAAAQTARDSGTGTAIVAVTALTSLSVADLRSIGVNRDMEPHITAMGELAVSAGCDGVVCSVLEAGAFRKKFGPDPILVTPGIRPSGSAVGDQKRVATPADAVKAGSNFLVVGRPIVAAPDPKAAALAILREVAEATS